MLPERMIIDSNECTFTENTYQTEVCDICGNRRKCDYWTCVDVMKRTGYDVCRSCARVIAKEGKK